MEVILLDSIPKLGDRGETVKVKPGYARNFLFPRKLALPATSANVNVFKEREQLLIKKDAERISAAQVIAGKITAQPVEISAQVGEEDKLYGSVTSSDIAKALADRGVEIDKRIINLEQPIKELGDFTVDVRLHREVVAPLRVSVVRQ